MPKKATQSIINELPLAVELEGEVKAWADQRWGQGTTQTTQDLLSYWFNRDLETDEKFHICQRRAIETIIYCHEILGIETLKQAFAVKTGNRDKSKSDFERPLFMPEGERFRNRFHLQVLEPADIRPNLTPPDEPFVYITNWQQFRLNESSNLWDQLTGADVEEQPRGEIIADFLSEYPDLIIFNDEAHHVHGAKTAKGEELVWRKFLAVLYERMAEKRGREKGVFLQIDFSATPFYGSAEKKEYFPHIVYDFDLVEAMRAMLVKQIFLEERQAM
ncbi:MAG: hypothetical protein HYS15_00380, partial [Candidatus Spechtbacteria bacterium]|nr:hypothetical protein [Candidatus Spechtbacteria bacterium]